MKNYIAEKSGLLSGLLIAVVLSFAGALANEEASHYFQQARELYETQAYETALPAFQKAVELAPLESGYHHMLGKCYGRIAETGSWFTALRYVRKTLSEFKKAVELDDNNTQAWTDLQAFYQRAPGFLGGSKDKAREIGKRLADLNVDESGD